VTLDIWLDGTKTTFRMKEFYFKFKTIFIFFIKKKKKKKKEKREKSHRAVLALG
jgi:hypothetical protein